MILRSPDTLFERLVDHIRHEDCSTVCSRRRCQFQQQAGPGLPVSFAGMPETVIAHLMEAFRQNVQKEATEELNPFESFGLPLVCVTVLVPKRHVTFVHGHQSMIGDRNPKNVAGEVSQDSVFTGSVRFAVRTPRSVPSMSRDLLEEVGMPVLQRLSKSFGNHPREFFYGNEKFLRCPVPGGSIIGHTAAGHQHVHVRMMMQSASPGVQDRQEAHLRTDVAFLGGQIPYGIGRTLDQQTIERLLIA